METNPILKYFNYKHLPAELQVVSKLFYDIVHTLEQQLPNNAETNTMLRKLLEAKDCAVRSQIK